VKELRLESYPLGGTLRPPPDGPSSSLGLSGAEPPGSPFHLRVFIPSPDRRGHRLPAGSLVLAVERLVLTVSDGFTMVRGRGAWRGRRGRLVRESVTVFDTYLPTSLPSIAWDNFLLSLRTLANDWKQEVILVAVDGRRILVPGAGSSPNGLSLLVLPRPRRMEGAR